jgi:site-specific DNA-methyltransferase (adenine-specific)
VLPLLEGGSVDLVLTDPPYFKTLSESWDHQWAKEPEFLAWLDGLLRMCSAAMQDNGTLYVFASPRMAASVEASVRKVARVIASCVWDKGQERNGAAGAGIDVTALRTFWASGSERCIVAEKKPERYEAADALAREASGYWDACQDTKRSIFGEYLRDEFERAGVSQRQIAALFPSRTGGLTGCVSNWLLGHNCPTQEQYQTMRDFLNTNGKEYLRTEYEDLRTEYEDLRTEYEDLRTEYEDLRRPFNLTAQHQWGDVWHWSVERRERRHPAQKPLAMICQIVEISSRPGDLILDPFAGSGTTGVASKRLGRKCVLVEIEEKYCRIAANRLRNEPMPLFVDEPEKPKEKQLELIPERHG